LVRPYLRQCCTASSHADGAGGNRRHIL